jgi:phosphatidylcholine synthase
VATVQAGPDTAPVPALKDVRLAWYIHLFTTSGVVVGMLAMQAVFDRKAKWAMLALLATQVIDGIDGPIARQYDVSTNCPKIDGYVLDLVIDYVTCVLVPAAFLHRFNLLPHAVSLPLAGLVVFLSAIWFARTDMMTDDNWFRGFPATWNLVAPTMLLLKSPQWLNAAIVLVLSLLQLTNVPFPHPTRIKDTRSLTLFVTIAWLFGLTWATFRWPRLSVFGRSLLIPAVAYYFGLAAWKTSQIAKARRRHESATRAPASR